MHSLDGALLTHSPLSDRGFFHYFRHLCGDRELPNLPAGTHRLGGVTSTIHTEGAWVHLCGVARCASFPRRSGGCPRLLRAGLVPPFLGVSHECMTVYMTQCVSRRVLPFRGCGRTLRHGENSCCVGLANGGNGSFWGRPGMCWTIDTILQPVSISSLTITPYLLSQRPAGGS